LGIQNSQILRAITVFWLLALGSIFFKTFQR
jgi:hypothetical protein